MIYLNEVCAKLEGILNGDGNPADFLYEVQSVGYHADSIYDKKSGRNLIRVFVSQMGGNFNPVFNLGEATYSIPITFYFPVRFKEFFFALDAYLHEVFVGAQIDYGANSGKAISNLSVAQYGELQDLDFKEFKNWADNLYQMPIEVMETYMSMTVNLYLSTIGTGYYYGNDITATLSWGNKELPLMFASGSRQTQTQPNQEQEIGAYEADGLPFSVSSGLSFQIYLSGSDECRELLGDWLSGAYIGKDYEIELTFPYMPNYTQKVYISSGNLIIQKGQPATLTLTFSKRYE